MRVIAGEFRSRKILSMPGDDVRPTPDRLRESLFSILTPIIEDCVFVDAYAGTGSVGIEAISRGARQVVFIEKNRQAVELIHKNLAELGATERARVIMGAAPIHLKGIKADIVFLDPPYPKEKEYRASLEILGAEALDPEAPPLVIVQHAVRFRVEETYGSLHRTRVVKQSDNALSFYAPTR